jgi:chromate transporter
VPSRREDVVPFRVAVRAWWAVSLQTFGGPAGQIAVMHRELVDERRWIGERRFLHALSYCTLLPGPEAQQLAIYLGWLLNGTLGGLVAGVLFVLPGFVAIMGLSVLYAGWGDTVGVEALFAGIAPAVLAIVAQAVVRVSTRALRNVVLVVMAVAAFVALFALGIPFPFVIAAAGLVGFVMGRLRLGLFRGSAHGAAAADAPAALIPDDALHGEPPSMRRAARIVAVGGVLWAAPIVAAAVLIGRSNVFVDEGLFFSGAAVVTFGGAYAVLSYVAQRAVEVYGWLAPGEMITGLAMAETTPGPLIMVVQFVGFMGAYGAPPSGMNPWVAGVLAATLVTWVTFVPCFLFIFLGAPHVEALRHNERLSAALTGITAAVVGVIANLAVFFAVHTLFSEVRIEQPGPFRFQVPDLSTFSPRAGAVAVLAFVLLFRLKWSVLRTLGTCAAVGATIHLVVS